MIENLNKLTGKIQFLMQLYTYLYVNRVLTARAHNDYNINPWNMSIKISLRILVII
jgi:hypothetical protein